MKGRLSPNDVMHERMITGKRWREKITPATAALLFSVLPAFSSENARVRHIDTLLDFVGFVTADCVQHYEEELKPEAVKKLHFSEPEVATRVSFLSESWMSRCSENWRRARWAAS
jgi:hypothetical protein